MKQPYRFKLNTSSFAHYWTVGVGVDLLKKLDYVPDLELAQAHIPLLFDKDVIGDEFVKEIHLKYGFSAGNRMLDDYLEKKALSKYIAAHFDEFIKQVGPDPDWLDWDLLTVGQEFCQRPGLTSLIVLRDYCLMGGYESAAINKPLIFTGALKKGAVKRLSDTVEFWVQISKPGSLGFREKGFQHVLRTRLIHSYSRLMILDKTQWEQDKWGVPLNTWDILASHLAFTQVFLVGLRKMGIQPTEREVAGLFHFWKYVSYLLGVPLSLLPDTEEKAIEQLYFWTMTQREGDQDSKDLAHALQEEPIHAFYPKTALMRKMMREIHLFYNHFLLGDYSCELLGLAKTTVGRLAMANIWRNRRLERSIITDKDRMDAIARGATEQENVRMIYQNYNQQNNTQS